MTYDINEFFGSREFGDGVMVEIRYLRNKYNEQPTLDIEVAWHDPDQDPTEEDPNNVLTFNVVISSERLITIGNADGYEARLHFRDGGY